MDRAHEDVRKNAAAKYKACAFQVVTFQTTFSRNFFCVAPKTRFGLHRPTSFNVGMVILLHYSNALLRQFYKGLKENLYQVIMLLFVFHGLAIVFLPFKKMISQLTNKFVPTVSAICCFARKEMFPTTNKDVFAYDR